MSIERRRMASHGCKDEKQTLSSRTKHSSIERGLMARLLVELTAVNPRQKNLQVGLTPVSLSISVSQKSLLVSLTVVSEAVRLRQWSSRARLMSIAQLQASDGSAYLREGRGRLMPVSQTISLG